MAPAAEQHVVPMQRPRGTKDKLEDLVRWLVDHGVETRSARRFLISYALKQAALTLHTNAAPHGSAAHANCAANTLSCLLASLRPIQNCKITQGTWGLFETCACELATRMLEAQDPRTNIESTVLVHLRTWLLPFSSLSTHALRRAPPKHFIESLAI